MSGTESLARIERSPKPNSALFASDGVEIAAKVDVHLPAYDMAPTDLFERAVQVFSEQKNTRVAEKHADACRASFVSTTPLLRFKDDIDLEVVALGDGKSGLILYSRSRVGYSDLGTNRKRLAHWVDQLNQLIKNT